MISETYLIKKKNRNGDVQKTTSEKKKKKNIQRIAQGTKWGKITFTLERALCRQGKFINTVG